jgi:hypothetical protein
VPKNRDADFSSQEPIVLYMVSQLMAKWDSSSRLSPTCSAAL